MEAESVIPAGAELLAADAALALVLAQQRGGHAAQHPQVLAGGPVLQPAVVLPEDHVQHPVQPVLHPPVIPRRRPQLRRAAAPAADVVRHLARLRAADPPEPRHPDDGPQVRPLVGGAQPAQVVQHTAGPLLLAAVAARLAQPQVVLDALEVGGDGRLEAFDDVGLQGRLVALDLQQVVGPALADRLGHLRLAAGGVDRHQSPLQLQQPQQPGDGGDLVGPVLDGHLAEQQGVGPDPGADQVQAGPAQAAAAAQGLAVDLDVVEAQPGAGGVDPGGEAVLEGAGGEVAEDVAEGVVAGDAVRQGQAQGRQPGLLGAAEGGDVFEALGPGEGGAQGDGQDVAGQVGGEARVAGVVQAGEVVGDAQAVGGGHRPSFRGGCPARIPKWRCKGNEPNALDRATSQVAWLNSGSRISP